MTNFSNISFSAELFCERNALWNKRMILFFSSFLKITRRAMSARALQLSANSLIARLNSPVTHRVQTGRDNALIIARWYFVAASGHICFKKDCPVKSAIQPNYGPRATMLAFLFHLLCCLLASYIYLFLFLAISLVSSFVCFANIPCASIFAVSRYVVGDKIQ